MYRLEKQTEPNVAVDLDSTLESQGTMEFCLVRENSSRGEESSEEDPPIDITTVQDMLSSHHYKSFKISMIHKLRFTTDVQLGTFSHSSNRPKIQCLLKALGMWFNLTG
ncbi:target of rapamycin complex 2 subunit MAPKAP1-like [Sinocyclocheilus grahami]|uniref:target of rapamycin complex 2 subunit MAPKAP1-like n=1 Tax=Sinocyclocheilus grahami TaxID=75366 RepID=UPI0007AC8C11|nr:PREDICTED: target of rapamycin complex 2 subunit MAPKAP1-like [Sinocyclocheilus grahami]